MNQIAMLVERVRLTYQRGEVLGHATTTETACGTVLRDFDTGDALVHFDGPKALGSVRGCVLLVPRGQLEAA